jgi:hypothetical protein
MRTAAAAAALLALVPLVHSLGFKPPCNESVLTNGARLARGLPPLTPSRLYAAHIPRAAPSGVSFPADAGAPTQSAGVIGAFAADGSFVGFYNLSASPRAGPRVLFLY